MPDNMPTGPALKRQEHRTVECRLSVTAFASSIGGRTARPVPCSAGRQLALPNSIAIGVRQYGNRPKRRHRSQAARAWLNRPVSPLSIQRLT